MKKFLDTLAVIMLIVSSTAVTIGVGIYVMNLPPVAHKSDLVKVEQKVDGAQAKANAAQSEANAANAVVSTAVAKHGKKLKTADERIGKLEGDFATLKTRVDDLDGSGLYPVPTRKHAHQ